MFSLQKEKFSPSVVVSVVWVSLCIATLRPRSGRLYNTVGRYGGVKVEIWLHHVFIFSNIGFQIAANDKYFFIYIINSWLLRFKNGSSFFNWLGPFFYFF
jgi:hypothetical protein